MNWNTEDTLIEIAYWAIKHYRAELKQNTGLKDADLVEVEIVISNRLELAGESLESFMESLRSENPVDELMRKAKRGGFSEFYNPR